jgi:integrase
VSSIEYRRNQANGAESWRVRFRHEGKNRSVAFASKPGAESWQGVLDNLGAAKALALLEEEKPASTRTVADQVDHHIEHLTGIEEGTRRRYAKIAERELRPVFGRTLLSDLTRDQVAEWVNELGRRPEPPAPKTVRNWHAVLSDALSTAVRDGLMPANPAKGIKLPKRDHTTEEMVFLTLEEYGLLLGHLPARWHPLVQLLALTGIRWGEATSLKIGDLDRATRSARVWTAWKHTESGEMRQGGPKSRRSRRTIAVPIPVFDALEPVIAGRRPTELVILSARGNPVRSGTFHNNAWQPAARALEAATGKKPRVHDLRHTWASWAIQNGVQLPVIQRQMGHESITTTIDTYGHLARSDFDPLLDMGAAIDAATRQAPPAIEPAPEA